MPSLNIKDEEVYRLARELAEANKTSMTAEIRAALKERQGRLGQVPERRSDLAEKIGELSQRSAARYQGADRTRDLFADLYDEDGLPR